MRKSKGWIAVLYVAAADKTRFLPVYSKQQTGRSLNFHIYFSYGKKTFSLVSVIQNKGGNPRSRMYPEFKVLWFKLFNKLNL